MPSCHGNHVPAHRQDWGGSPATFAPSLGSPSAHLRLAWRRVQQCFQQSLGRQGLLQGHSGEVSLGAEVGGPCGCDRGPPFLPHMRSGDQRPLRPRVTCTPELGLQRSAGRSQGDPGSRLYWGGEGSSQAAPSPPQRGFWDEEALALLGTGLRDGGRAPQAARSQEGARGPPRRSPAGTGHGQPPPLPRDLPAPGAQGGHSPG